MTTTPETTEASDTEEIPLRQVTLTLCVLCLSGAGGECHSPGCTLFLNRAPDLPVLTDQEAIERYG